MVHVQGRLRERLRSRLTTPPAARTRVPHIKPALDAPRVEPMAALERLRRGNEEKELALVRIAQTDRAAVVATAVVAVVEEAVHNHIHRHRAQQRADVSVEKQHHDDRKLHDARACEERAQRYERDEEKEGE